MSFIYWSAFTHSCFIGVFDDLLFVGGIGMKLRVRYYKHCGLWVGQVQYKDDGIWINETQYCWTKYGAKRELRKWYKREVAPEKIEEIEPADLVGGELIDILKPLLIGLAVACFAVFICAKYL